MKIFITGATGYIGHNLAKEAVRQGYVVHILVRDVQSKHLPVHPSIIPFAGDITDKEVVTVAMRGCETVLHAAAITKMFHKDSNIFYRVNVEGTRNVLDAALELGVKKLVYTSTCMVIGPSGNNPMCEDDPRIIAFENDYEISKHWAEELVKEYCSKGLPAVIVAAPKVYGPGQECNGNIMHGFLKSILSTHLAFMPSCENIVGNYAFLEDIVKGHFLALSKGKDGEKYILGGENISYGKLFQTIKNSADKKILVIRVPKMLIKTFCLFYMFFNRLIGRETHISPKAASRLTKNSALNCNKAIAELGYTITPFAEGMSKTILHLSNRELSIGQHLTYAKQ